MHIIQLHARVIEQLCAVAVTLGLNPLDYEWEVEGVPSGDDTNVAICSAKAIYRGGEGDGFRIGGIYYDETTGEILRRERFTER